MLIKKHVFHFVCIHLFNLRFFANNPTYCVSKSNGTHLKNVTLEMGCMDSRKYSSFILLAIEFLKK